MDALQSIRRPIEREMERYRQLFDSRLQHANPILAQALPVIAQRKGKMMRPILTLLAAKLVSGENLKSRNNVGTESRNNEITTSRNNEITESRNNEITEQLLPENALYAAAAFEFFHTASLLHDDVVDESDERRGQASINSTFGNKVAVLVGDYLLAQSLYCASKTGSPRLVETISVAAQSLADGELLQLNTVSDRELSEATYYSIIKNKTAALFAACAEAGVLAVSSDETAGENVSHDETMLKTLRQFGETVGICFQIRDDIFDYRADAAIGKPTGNDMKEGKLTLPAIHALQKTGDAAMAAIAEKVKEGRATDDEIAEIIDFTERNGGIDYAMAAMNAHADKAKKLLDIFPDSDAKQSLVSYVDFVVARTV